jgi:tetratricopeptide (TPR) repeat protein
MSLFDGLHLYELVLLVLGVVLFLVLVIMLIISAMQGRSIKALLLFFVLPILMIGFPAIRKVKLDKDGFEIDKLALVLAQNPSDEAAKKKLEALVSAIKPRANESAQALVKVARAEAVLGQPTKAVDTLDQALKRNPELTIAKDLKARLKVLPRAGESAETRRAVEANIALKPEG